jgi:hypothetical protein
VRWNAAKVFLDKVARFVQTAEAQGKFCAPQLGQVGVFNLFEKLACLIPSALSPAELAKPDQAFDDQIFARRMEEIRPLLSCRTL